jgi:hypothetical protein
VGRAPGVTTPGFPLRGRLERVTAEAAEHRWTDLAVPPRGLVAFRAPALGVHPSLARGAPDQLPPVSALVAVQTRKVRVPLHRQAPARVPRLALLGWWRLFSTGATRASAAPIARAEDPRGPGCALLVRAGNVRLALLSGGCLWHLPRSSASLRVRVCVRV